MESHQNPSANVQRNSSLYKAMGYLVALSLLLLAFEWKTFTVFLKDTLSIKNSGEEIQIQAIIIPNTPPPPPVAAPPPPDIVDVIKIVENDKEIENELEVENADAPDVLNVAVSSGGTPDPGPAEEVNDNEVFMVVEEMPRFAGCESIKDEEKAQECFQKEIGKFLGKNIVYPQRAKEANVEGIVYVSFVVGTDGNVKDVKLLRGIGFGCDEEALRVISKLPRFTPGKQRGRPAQVSYNIPINFKLR
ncbi:MAG: energy transducer TonB [Flavobacteriales bacterium]|nr:energy transducer TonB [Flavobacteriales bacterium]MCX7650958.1 energy transducer TonB [Flavobacteriales bacterium]MDW8433038.1 energy transducer TonB [Flavobacteriales bacterium]